MPQWFFVNTWSTMIKLIKRLGRNDFAKTDARLYDRFIKCAERYESRSTTAQRELGIANLYWAHPVQPSAEQAIRFLRKTSEQKSNEEVQRFWPQNQDAKRVFLHASRNALDVARKTDLRQDARWLEAKIAELFPTAMLQSVSCRSPQYERSA